jgi:hypothetical protein
MAPFLSRDDFATILAFWKGMAMAAIILVPAIAILMGFMWLLLRVS